MLRRLAIALVAIASFSAVGCGDDDTDPPTSDDTEADSTTTSGGAADLDQLADDVDACSETLFTAEEASSALGVAVTAPAVNEAGGVVLGCSYEATTPGGLDVLASGPAEGEFDLDLEGPLPTTTTVADVDGTEVTVSSDATGTATATFFPVEELEITLSLRGEAFSTGDPSSFVEPLTNLAGIAISNLDLS